jgi:large subunit ribosomal protein L21
VAATKAKKKTASKSYAIVETGGKQFRVSPGDVIDVERLAAEKGSVVELDRVLLVAEGKEVQIGTPVVAGAKVTADVLGEEKGDKVIVYKYKSKVRYRNHNGHRQIHTQLAIKDIISK